MNKRMKNIFNIVFLIFCFVATIYYVFYGEDLDVIIHYIKNAKWFYWLLGICCVVIFILSESAIIYYLLRHLKHKVSIRTCSLYSFVGFFFSAITPSASGGQPAQAVFMKRDGIPLHVSAIVLLMVTISYKMVLLLYGGIILIFKPTGVYSAIESIIHWVYLGMTLNVVIVSFMVLLSVKPKIIESVVLGIFKLLMKLFKNEKWKNYKRKAAKSMKRFSVKSQFLLQNKMLLGKVLIITFFQRTIFFFITYLVLKSFHLLEINPIDTTIIQGGISVAVDMLPLPGGMGITEHLFLGAFANIVKENIIVPAMIVSRGISYYTQLLLSAFMTGFAYLKFYVTEHKERLEMK